MKRAVKRLLTLRFLRRRRHRHRWETSAGECRSSLLAMMDAPAGRRAPVGAAPMPGCSSNRASLLPRGRNGTGRQPLDYASGRTPAWVKCSS